MTKLDALYEPVLTVRDLSLAAGEEWVPRLPGWSFILVESGQGCWVQSRARQELETGSVLLLSACAQGAIQASPATGVSLRFFRVQPECLTGLITSNERRFFEAAASQERFALHVLPPQNPAAIRMKELCSGPEGSGPAFRLQLLLLFTEVFASDLKQEAHKPESAGDAKERLRGVLKQTPPAELLHLSFADLVQATRCTPRHLTRIFQEVVGRSFRDMHAELRLARACELLVTTESKVVDVALESGYHSLSLFNLMFTRYLGTSPSKWRQTQRGNAAGTPPSRRNPACLASP